MKRTTIILSLIFALAIALSVSIPTLALELSTDGTVVGGTVKTKVEISAPPGPISLGELPNDDFTTATVIVHVKCNKIWTLTATADNMKDTSNPVNTLQNPLDGRVHLTTTWDPFPATFATDHAKTTSTGVDTAIDLRQTIVDYTDTASDTYKTTVIFTVTY